MNKTQEKNMKKKQFSKAVFSDTSFQMFMV